MLPMESGSKGKQLMSRYRKTMAEAYGSVVENSAIQMQIATLKKAYEPLRNKRISMDNANKLMKIMDKFDVIQGRYTFCFWFSKCKTYFKT
jgi:hypothetical protein